MARSLVDSIGRAMSGPQNLTFSERILSIVFGLGLAASAVKPRRNPLVNLVALAGGSYLALRGAYGHCPVKQAFDDGAPRPPERMVVLAIPEGIPARRLPVRRSA